PRSRQATCPSLPVKFISPSDNRTQEGSRCPGWSGASLPGWDCPRRVLRGGNPSRQGTALLVDQGDGYPGTVTDWPQLRHLLTRPAQAGGADKAEPQDGQSKRITVSLRGGLLLSFCSSFQESPAGASFASSSRNSRSSPSEYIASSPVLFLCSAARR